MQIVTSISTPLLLTYHLMYHIASGSLIHFCWRHECIFINLPPNEGDIYERDDHEYLIQE